MKFDKVVFCCGVNRSGTHLLMSLLSNHEDIFVTGLEDGFLTGLAEGGDAIQAAIAAGSIGKLYRALSARTELTTHKIMSLRRSRNHSHAIDAYQAQVDFPVDFDAVEKVFIRNLTDDSFGELSIGEMADLFDAYYDALAREMGEKDKPVAMSKPGTGLQALERAAEFLRPERLTIVYMLRDPRGLVASATKGKGPVVPAAQEWRTDFEVLERISSRFDLLVVRYEDLCQRTRETMETVGEFLGVPFSETMLVPSLHGGQFEGNSSFEKMGRAVSAKSVSRWREVLDEDAVRTVEAVAGPCLERAGYDRAYPLSPLAATLSWAIEAKRALMRRMLSG